MAVSCKMRFGTMSGVKTWTFSDWNDGVVTTQMVKDLAQAMITNGSVYKYPPLSLESAKVVTTTEQDYILN